MSMFDLRDDERESAARHVQFARSEAARIADIPVDTPQRPVRFAAVVGASSKGSNVALALAEAGVGVTLIDTDAQALERAFKRVRDHLDYLVQRKRLSQEDAAGRATLVRLGRDLSAAAQADLVLECLPEDLAVKEALFRRLDSVAKPNAIMATTTASLDVDVLAGFTERPHDVLGMHFFSPAHLQRVVEVVRGDRTAPEVVATMMTLGRRMRKIAVLTRAYPGYIGNALFRQYHREAHFAVEDGAMPHEVDAALTRFGFSMGIFAVHDMAGNDVGLRAPELARGVGPPGETGRRNSELISKLVQAGRLGQKVGKGWYRYESGSRQPLRDPQVEEFIVAESERQGMIRRPVDRDEILQRCLFGMANEGARLLERGVAQRPSDIDIVYISAFGFPREQGGPMFMADRIGLPKVLEVIQGLHHQLGAWWEPAPLLRQLAGSGRSFGQWQASRGV